MALTAAAPIYKGFLADVECRWDFIGATLDDRTEEEKGLKVGFRNIHFFPFTIWNPGD